MMKNRMNGSNLSNLLCLISQQFLVAVDKANVICCSDVVITTQLLFEFQGSFFYGHVDRHNVHNDGIPVFPGYNLGLKSSRGSYMGFQERRAIVLG